MRGGGTRAKEQKKEESEKESGGENSLEESGTSSDTWEKRKKSKRKKKKGKNDFEVTVVLGKSCILRQTIVHRAARIPSRFADTCKEFVMHPPSKD